MAVDITNHLIPYAQVKRMLAKAWDEGFNASENNVTDTPNPYRDET